MLKNISVTNKGDIENDIEQLWLTSEIKHFWKTNPLCIPIKKRLAKGCLLWYSIETPQQRNHLTSHARVIGRRQYTNPWIQDLYYLHELVHTAHFDYLLDNHHEKSIALNMSINELYASMFSEVVIYFAIPTLIGKTFIPLWASNFMPPLHPDRVVQCLDTEHHELTTWLNRLDDRVFEFENWPLEGIHQSYHRRLELRNGKNAMLPGEKTIVAYNSKRDPWILKWKSQYKNVKHAIQLAQLDSEKFETFVRENVSPRGVVFPI